MIVCNDMDDFGFWLLKDGRTVDTGHWQAMKDVPQTRTIEIRNAILEVGINDTIEDMQHATKCNLPWAEDHFLERVSGEPLNPPPSAGYWPFMVKGHEGHLSLGQFSHTYPERFWPRYAGQNEDTGGPMTGASNMGIRYRYGDLQSVVDLMKREPYTRQAYLPVWFPEDTGAHHGERVPCSLGYHFLLRNGYLHCNYFIRSVDFYRHFPDDVYMAMRLTHWLLERLKDSYGGVWDEVKTGILVMHMSSLHVFEAELPRLAREYKKGLNDGGW